MTALEALLNYRREIAMIETELQVMELTVKGTLMVNDDCRVEPYALQPYDGSTN